MLFGDPVAVYNPQPFKNLTKYTDSYMDFAGYISAFAPRHFPENVIVTYPPYFRKLQKLVESTTAEVLQAYFVSQAALRLSPLLGLNTEPWRVVTEFNQALSGIKKGTPVDREKWCLAQLQDGFGFMAGRFFVNDVFGGLFTLDLPSLSLTRFPSSNSNTAPSAREKAFNLVDNVITAFNDGLPKLKWMEPDDRKAAAEKVRN